MMRRLFPFVALFAAILVVLGVVLLSRPGAPDAVVPPPAAPTDEVVSDLTPLSVPASAPGETSAPDQRVAAGAPSIAMPAVDARLERHLRVRVVVEGRPAESTTDRAVPPKLEVQICNQIGAVFDPYRDGASEFLFRSLRAGSYVVVAKCEGFATAWQRVDVRSDLLETTVELVVKRARLVRVRWAGSDGRPVHEFLKVPDVAASGTSTSEDPARVRHEGDPRLERNPDGSVRVGPSGRPGPILQRDSVRVRLAALVSRVVPPEHGPLHASIVSRRWTRFLVVERDESGANRVGSAPWMAPSEQPDDPAPNPPPDSFTLLEIDEPGRVFVSVWRDDSRLDGAWVEPNQTEVSFVTPPEALNFPWCTVRARVLDALTGLPIEGASIVLQVGTQSTTDADGRSSLHVPPGDHELKVFAEEHDDVRVRVKARPSLEVDLGDVRLPRDSQADAGRAQLWFATFRIVDANGVPSPHGSVRLVPIDDYDGMRLPVAEGVVEKVSPFDTPAPGADVSLTSASKQGLVTFGTTRLGSFVLLAERPELDVAPRLVSESDFSRDRSRVVDEIVVRMPKIVSFRFVEPPHPGTQIVVETPTGLPVAVLDTNEFGVVQTWLGTRSYRIHLVEDGAATDSVSFTVDADPFVFEIRR